jgi:hypothetical protein
MWRMRITDRPADPGGEEPERRPRSARNSDGASGFGPLGKVLLRERLARKIVVFFSVAETDLGPAHPGRWLTGGAEIEPVCALIPGL